MPGLARRSQAPADRQLQLREDLARDEAERQRRQGLLGVDHLATRLRRTAETLLAVTGGPGPARRGARPARCPSPPCSAPPSPRPSREAPAGKAPRRAGTGPAGGGGSRS